MPMRLMTCCRRLGSMGSMSSPTRAERALRNVLPITGPGGSGGPCLPVPASLRARRPRSARSVEARARTIEHGGYGFGDRATVLLGSAATADTLALVQQTLRATNPAGFMQAARFIAEAEMPPLAAGLTMPLLMVQGEKDRVAPAATNAELLAAALPVVRLVILAGCGHLPEVEFPSPVNDLIAAHMS
jgi:pimeloyl-ACP methyl ester carboxylesterase